MKTLLVLTLAVACGSACAETPANNPMPDGSRDLYIGVGAILAPDYQGAAEKRTSALPLVQAEWSNGMFISGLSAGWHLSRRAGLEFGPLLAVDGGRDQDGPHRAGDASGGMSLVRLDLPDPDLNGMQDVKARLQGGFFVNHYLDPSLRVASSLLYGAGNERDGAVMNLALQYSATDWSPHHKVFLSAGMNLVNRAYNRAFFGVTKDEAVLSGHAPYAPGGGLRDIYVGGGWNWALSPSWMIVSAARLSRLRGDARHSPLVQRPTNFSVSSGLVYRF
jgi:outer membrane scaffolding protein for murein synthesis (MipA/OmpV family)